jgi:hypothetical protein
VKLKCLFSCTHARVTNCLRCVNCAGVRASEAKFVGGKYVRERRPSVLSQEERFWQLPSDLPKEPCSQEDAIDRDLVPPYMLTFPAAPELSNRCCNNGQ